MLRISSRRRFEISHSLLLLLSHRCRLPCVLLWLKKEIIATIRLHIQLLDLLLVLLIGVTNGRRNSILLSGARWRLDIALLTSLG